MRRYLIPLLAALALWGVIALRASGDSGWQTLENGLEVRTITHRSGLATQTITAVRAPAARVHIGSEALLRAPDWNRARGSVAAINGGYFDDQSHAIGLRIAQGKRTNKFYARANWGVFVIRDGRAFIAHTRDYKGSPRTREALQCGPRLVVNGKTTDLKPQSARRSGVGIQASGKIVLAVSDGALSFDDWAALWADRNRLNCRDALNLDGGPSTQMSVVSARHPVTVRGGWPVPDAILVR